MTRSVFVSLLIVHGAIHGMGTAKAFGWAGLAQLRQPISTGMGIAWACACLLLLVTAALVAARSRAWWAVAAVAVVLSQWVITSAWSDAKFGTIANVLIAAAAIYGFASVGPLSLRAAYDSGSYRRCSPW